MSITFALTSIDFATVSKNPCYPLDWAMERYNQSALETADGGLAVYDNGPSVVRGTINIKSVSKSEGDALRTFLTTSAICQKNAMTITPPANTDLGNGNGVAITNVNFDGGQSLAGVFTLIPPGIYDVSIPYRYKVA